VATGIGGQFVLCSACLKKVLGILLRVFQFIINIIWKKELSPKAPIELVKEFPILLGAFAKLRKATISFVMSVRPSVSMEQLGSHWTDFHEIRYLRIFRNFVQKIQVSLKSDKNNA
jgi:hypothetical protein